MLEKERCYKTRSEITAIEANQNGTLLFSTRLHGAKVFSYQTCNSVKNLSIELLGHKTTATAFNESEALLVFANATTIYVLDLNTKLTIQTIRTYEGEIEQIAFVPHTKYIVTGTKNGRVMQYRYDGRAHISRLCSFGHNLKEKKRNSANNYVSAFAFYENLIACSGYGGEIRVLKMHTYAQRVTIDSSKVRINTLCFLDKNTLVSGNVDGLIQIHSLKKHQTSKKISAPFREINKIILMENPRYIMVSGASKDIILIDTQSAKIVSKSYLSLSANVSNILLADSETLLALINKTEIEKIELPSVAHLKSYLLHNELNKAYALIEKDPMLQGTREHKRVEVMYEKFYSQAINALIDSNTKEARRLMQMFSDVASKREDIDSIFKAFEHYPRFKGLYLEKKYALAYPMAEKFPALKRTKQYKKMEESFKEAYTFAQKQILIGRADLAKEILSSYATVLSKKPMLKLLLNQNEDFIEFLKAINTKDYVSVWRLVKTDEMFAHIPTYIALQNEIDSSLKSIQTDIYKNRLESAVEKIKSMMHIPSIKEELQELYSLSKLVSKLHSAYEADNFVECYEIIDSSSELDALELSKLLESHYSKVIYKAEESALKGDLKGIKKVLGEFIHIKTREDQIGDLLRLSFYVKIKTLLAKHSFKAAESIIYSYLDIFGLDSEIRLIMKTFEGVSKKKLAITLDQDNHRARNEWKNSELIMQ